MGMKLRHSIGEFFYWAAVITVAEFLYGFLRGLLLK